jgi:rhamnosyltransferase subunit B
MPESTHYLIITTGTTGDVHPFLHIARALQAMGRQVTFIRVRTGNPWIS